MKFDPFKFVEVQPNAEIQIKKGWLRLRSSRQAALFITAEGFEALAGVGYEFSLQISEVGTARLETADDARVFVEVSEGTSYSTSEEAFTNIDRMVQESGTMLEIKKALRAFQLERSQAIAQIRAESHALAMQREQAKAPPAPAPAPAPDPAPNPAPNLDPAPKASE